MLDKTIEYRGSEIKVDVIIIIIAAGTTTQPHIKNEILVRLERLRFLLASRKEKKQEKTKMKIPLIVN